MAEYDFVEPGRGQRAGQLFGTHPCARAAQRAADTRRNLAILSRDGDDVALWLAFNAKPWERIFERHQCERVDAHKYDVWIRLEPGERSVDNLRGPVQHMGQRRHGGFVHPT